MLIKVEFASFALDPGRNTPLVILRETNGARMIPLAVGPMEATAIAIETLGVATEKPLTIDVAKCILEELGGRLLRVVLDTENSGSVFARLDLIAQGGIHCVRCRPCDAIALALRCKAPLFVREELFESVNPESTRTGNAPRSEKEQLRANVSSLDTIEFGSHHLE